MGDMGGPHIDSFSGNYPPSLECQRLKVGQVSYSREDGGIYAKGGALTSFRTSRPLTDGCKGIFETQMELPDRR